MAKTIYLIDVTNRDGVQTAKLGLAKLEKTMINYYLNELGIFQSECGFPTPRHESNSLNANMELAKEGVLEPIILSGWMRAVVSDVELAFRLTWIRDINLSISTSEQMTQGKFQGRKTREDVLHEMEDSLRRGRGLGPGNRGRTQ